MNNSRAIFVSGRLDNIGGRVTIIEPNQVPAPLMVHPRALLMEPGSSASHRGFALASELGISIYWIARGGTKLLGYDANRSLDIGKLTAQVKMTSDPDHARAAARYMLNQRFGIRTHPGHSIAVIRGKEGAAVKKAYRALTNEYGIQWEMRRYDQPWNESSQINRAISVATSSLYALTEIAITMAGYSPHLGAIHRSNQRAFVFDIADMEKLNSVIPLAFRATATGSLNPEWITRAWCASHFRTSNLLDRLIKHTENVIDASKKPSQSAPRRGRRALPQSVATDRRRENRL